MSKVFLVSYATDRFERVRRELNSSAIEMGISNILSYSTDDLHGSTFYQLNRSILDAECGAGYWSWKPYFILEALEHLKEGDVLFYCDAGTKFVLPPLPLIELCCQSPAGVVVFDARPLTNRQFTKRDCFIRMDCDALQYWDANEVIATLIVIRKCDFSHKLMREWLSYCQDPQAITDAPNQCGKDDLPGFLQHRHDQAILSVLVAKHGLETYRNPTIWGNFLKLPEFRVKCEEVFSPYHLVPSITGYARNPQENSRYGTIFDINRQPNMVGKKPLPANRSADRGDRGPFRFLKERAVREVWKRLAKGLGYKAEKASMSQETQSQESTTFDLAVDTDGQIDALPCWRPEQ